ncbi:GH3 auxin-responsive promoter family protein [Roseivirga sp. UBA838]|uniref:GH3 family domain-containing protein n=1 Tax=Roseivirga sp. UBA838 TaxID=1947393 RepID=UPI0025799657|nr:GH3 auxin-responsive promoter family protein [Roseivirga sp. UBA838]|tara:strand:+ start:5569 stop:7098 length:1530 start_codon:yes stop_codon:yes gene_type:complete
MPLLGKIIKKAIDVGGQIAETNDSPSQLQQTMLRELLERAKDTVFGKAYAFEELLRSETLVEDFRSRVPTFDYKRMKEAWWHKTIEGLPDISWPGTPEYFALSSGTTGNKSKRIPVTQEMIEAIRETGLKQVLSLSEHDLPDSFFEKQILMLGSSTDLKEVDGHYEGEISGISASNIPFWFRGYYKPGEEIAGIDDWDERVEAIAKKAPEWDIGAISGIPSWIELMLKKVIEWNKVESIHDLWPNLAVYNSGGVAFEPYRASFDSLTSKPMLYLDTYLASEGFLAYQARPNQNMAMQLSLNTGIYFEFIPFEEKYFDEYGSPFPEAPALSLNEVELEKDYAILISTVSGAWRYSIGDTVKFTDLERAEIKITGRTKHFLNVVGSQLSVAKMNEAIQELEERFGAEIPEFTVGAVQREGEFYHLWFLGLGTAKDLNAQEVSEALDELLKTKNKNYRVARSKALKGVDVRLITAEDFHRWNAEKKQKGGQVKTPRMMNEESLKEFEHFLEA